MPSRPKQWKKTFLETFAQTANVRLACARVGVNRSTAYRAREKDDKFAEQWDEALDDALDRLEEECIRRGRDGTDELVSSKLSAGNMKGQLMEEELFAILA
ncbi:MAG TPA: hypothetical protein VJ810_10680 [Blastocatellia bacterium]|nr:hypothetical protein [Blastocatellia bacterium]